MHLSEDIYTLLAWSHDNVRVQFTWAWFRWPLTRWELTSLVFCFLAGTNISSRTWPPTRVQTTRSFSSFQVRVSTIVFPPAFQSADYPPPSAFSGVAQICTRAKPGSTSSPPPLPGGLVVDGNPTASDERAAPLHWSQLASCLWRARLSKAVRF